MKIDKIVQVYSRFIKFQLPKILTFHKLFSRFVMNSMKTCACVMFYFMKKSFSDVSRKWILPNMIRAVDRLHSLYWSIHTKDESKRETAFAFIFGVN